MAKGSVIGRAAAILQIREGEGSLVGWLFLHAALSGIPLTVTLSAASALFLEHHGAEALPWAYLASAMVVPAAGWLCLRIERRATFERFLFAVVCLVLAGEILARASVHFLGPVRGTWALPVWTEVEYSLTNLQLWALAGRLVNVQQAKRLFGVIGSGALLAGGLAGLAAPFFVRLVGTENLLILSALSTLGALFVLRRICKNEKDRLAGTTGSERASPRAKRAAARAARAKAKPAPAAAPKTPTIVVVAGGSSKSKGRARKNAPPPPPKPATADRPSAIPAELRPYLRATYTLMALSFVSYYLLERVFYDRAEARMPVASDLASFLGIFFGASGLLSLVFRVWLSSKLLSRWGLAVGLMTLPLVVAIGSGSAAAAGLSLGLEAIAVFWAVVVTRGIGGVLRESLDLQAALMLYQPLPKAQRVAVQGMAEGIVGPLAGGFAGASLLVLGKVGVDVTRLALILAIIGLCWALVANYLRRAYRTVLERALADHRLKRSDLVLGESARAPLLRALESPWAGEVLYALDMLEEIGLGGARREDRARDDDAKPATVLRKLLGHSAAEVRREALRRIDRGALTELLPDVATVAKEDEDPRVRGRAYRVLAAIADDDEAERIWLEVALADARVRREVMTGCLASGCIDRIALAWAELRRLAESPDPAQRVLAAQILRKVASPAFHRPLLKLLEDPDKNVQRAALVACKTVQHPRLLPIVIDAMRSRALRAAAAATLASIGEGAVVALRDFVHEETNWRVRVRALRVAARVRGRIAERLALDLIESPTEEIRHAALLTLVACGHRPTDAAGGAVFERLLQDELTEATWTLGAILDLDVVAARLSLTGGPLSLGAPTYAWGADGSPLSLDSPLSRVPSSVTSSSIVPSSSVPSSAVPSGPGAIDPEGQVLVVRALRRELAGSRERILLLLSFLYDAQSIHAARANYASSSTDRRAIALELLDSALPASIRTLVFPLFDDVAPKQALRDMPDDVVDEDAELQGRRGRLRDLLDPTRTNVTAWTRTCAIWALRDEDTVRQLANSTDEDVRETARFVLKHPTRRPAGGHVMLTVEKVLILRAVPMFERTPDHILSELAGILKEVDLGANVELMKEGDFGDCMFVIVHGGVKVHRGDEVLAKLGPRDIVGEMSVLDPEPRSASVTTTVATRLLRIDRDDFFDMMADRIEIAQGILEVLCQRLRGAGTRQSPASREVPSST